MHSRTELIGSVDEPPQISELPSGITFTTFTLTTKERAKTLNGEWDDIVDSHQIEFYGITAQYIFDTVTPNSVVMVVGKNKKRAWSGPQGKELFYTVVEGYQFKPIWINKAEPSIKAENTQKSHFEDNDFQLSSPDSPNIQHRPRFEDNEIPPDTFDDDIDSILDPQYILIDREEHE